MPVFTTACPRNCYSTCSMRVYVDKGRLRMIEPIPDNAATPYGICLKGLSYIERVYASDRLLYPLKRNQKSRNFERISWEDTFDLIRSNLVRLKHEYGPHSILYYSASGTKGLLNQIGMNFWKLLADARPPMVIYAGPPGWKLHDLVLEKIFIMRHGIWPGQR